MLFRKAPSWLRCSICYLTWVALTWPAPMLLAQETGPAYGDIPQKDRSVATRMPESRRFRLRERAEDEAARLREERWAAEVRAVKRTVSLKSLQLRNYKRRDDAQSAASKLQEYGIDAGVFGSQERGYAVSAGAFRDNENVQRLYRRIQGLGFTNARILTLQVTLVEYVVEAVEQRQEEQKRAEVSGAAQAADGGNGVQQSDVLEFGNAPEPLLYHGYGDGSGVEKEVKNYSVTTDLRMEAGGLTEPSETVEGSHYLHMAVSGHWRPQRQWEFQIGGRLDGYVQTGTPGEDEWVLDYGDTFVRYRGDGIRITAGTQTVIWGRVDEIPPTDRLSVQDLRRYILDDLAERRRAMPSLRFEGFTGAYKADLIWLPQFRAAELPALDSIWSPVDQARGRLAGLPPDPLLSPLIKFGSFGEEDADGGGYGLRLSRAGEGLDFAVTVQRVRHSLPYYELDPAVRTALLATMDPYAALAAAAGDTFVARHPKTWVIGGDLGFEAAGATWRFETAYLSDVPVTTADLRMDAVAGVDWVAGVEFYPGDSDARVNLQLAGHNLLDPPAILDRERSYTFNGSLEDVFDHQRWRVRTRFSFGLDERDVYLNPQIAYIGWEPHEFSIGAHYFEGSDDTLGGFHEDHSLVTLGWRAKY